MKAITYIVIILRQKKKLFFFPLRFYLFKFIQHKVGTLMIWEN